MSTANPMLRLHLDGSPPCTVHLSSSANNPWIAEAVQKRTKDIRKAVDALCEGRNVRLVETHGPGMPLPQDYNAGKLGNTSGFTGVTIHRHDGEVLRSTEPYSTMGGGLVLQRFNPDSAAQILLKALTRAQTLLQSSSCLSSPSTVSH